MPTMTCPPADQLKAFYLGKLTDERSEELVAHVGECTLCQAELETVIDSEDSLIVDLRAEDTDRELDVEPACELGMIRALGALADASESNAGQNEHSEESESLPKSIGDYEIIRGLGAGGMGRVYLAKHSKLGRLVALKILAGPRLGDRRASQRFEAEMRAIGRLSHPNIVTAHDAREIDGMAVLVTEFVDGFDLGQLMRRTGPLKVADACEIVRRVAVALQYTSDQGFVHRDVKPSNIMLSHSGEVKLLDLGLARLQYGDVEVSEFTATGQTMGTADYISPEQVKDSRTVDVRSDIYSLGATLFKLLVGRAPFADEKHSSAFAKMTAHVSTTPVSVRNVRSEVPEGLSQLVATMLAKEPDARPQRPDEVARRLLEFSAGNQLESLVQNAAMTDGSATTKETLAPEKVEPRTQSIWARPVRLYVAIAAGFVGMLLGLCLGIIITIKNPDGSKTVMHLPAGSQVELSEGESDASTRGSDSKASMALGKSQSAPMLEFGLILGSVEQITAADQEHGVRFVPVAPGVEVPKLAHVVDGSANKLAMISLDPVTYVNAQELWGHILETKIIKVDEGYALELAFDDRLSKRMLLLTRAHEGLQLAIIVEGKVFAAPRIVTPIRSDAIISGMFTVEQLQRLKTWLDAAKPVALNSGLMKGDSVLSENQQIVNDFSAASVGQSFFGSESTDEFQTRLHRAILGFALSLHGDRSAPITDNNLEQLSAAICMLDSSRRIRLEAVKSVVKKTWPFDGVTGVLPGVPADARWLLSEREKSYTLVIDPQAILPSVRTLVDELAGQSGIFDDVVRGIANDPAGPRIDLRELIQHLGSELVVCTGAKSQPITVYAFSLKNPAAVEAMLKNYSNSTDAIRVVKKYLVLGATADVELVAARVNPAPEKTSAEHLKMLGLAFANFESTYRQLPTSKNNREGGGGFKGPRAKHPFSWRVAILPFVEHAELFQQYDFNEPWDHEKNLKLLDKMPDVFRSPNAPADQKVGETNYLGFVGDACAMGAGEGAGVRLADITDGTSATVLLVETKRTVPWTKPEDLLFKAPEDGKQAEPFDGLGLNCLMVDGTVLSLDVPIDWERLGRLVTRNGGEPF